MGKDTFLDALHNSLMTRKTREALSGGDGLFARKWTDRARLVICIALISLCVASCSLPRIVVLDDPLSPEEHMNLGVAYEKNAELDNALEEYKKASKDLPLAYTYMGNIYFRKGEFDHAERYYKKAIENDPDSSDAYNNLAWLYYTGKTHLDEAEGLVLKAIQINPSKKDVYNDTLEKIRELKRSIK